MPASSSSLSVDEFTALVAALTYRDVTVSGKVGGNKYMYCSADGQVCYNFSYSLTPEWDPVFISGFFFVHFFVHTVVVELDSVCPFNSRSPLLGLCCLSILF